MRSRRRKILTSEIEFMTTVPCPCCKTILSIPSEVLGKPVLCTACSTRFIPDVPETPSLVPQLPIPADSFAFGSKKTARSAELDDDRLSTLELRRLITPAIRWLRISAGLLFVFWVLCFLLALVMVVALVRGQSANHWGFSVPVVLLVIVVGSAVVVLSTGAGKLDRRRDPGWIWAAGVTSVVLAPLLLLIGVGCLCLPFVMRKGSTSSVEVWAYAAFALMGLSGFCLMTGLKTLRVLRDPDVSDSLSGN